MSERITVQEWAEQNPPQHGKTDGPWKREHLRPYPGGPIDWSTDRVQVRLFSDLTELLAWESTAEPEETTVAADYTCDKCGKSIHGYPVYITKLDAFRVMDFESHLCESCAKDLRKVMRDWMQDGGEVTQRDIRTMDHHSGDVLIYYRGVLAGGIKRGEFTEDRALYLVRDRERRRRAKRAQPAPISSVGKGDAQTDAL